MKVNLISVLFVAIMAVTLAGGASADGTMANHIGYASTHMGVGSKSVDIEDYLSVYRFVMPMFGAFDVAMFDERTPATVANLRRYADRGDYDQMFIHRSISTATSGIGIVQGGGFTFSDAVGSPSAIATDPPVLNEPGIANDQGTIALAKTGAGPSTGTSQWYFNTSDNPTLDLPANNGGYTVFGEVLYDGMDVVGRDGEGGGIAGLRTFTLPSPFDNLPLSDDFVSGSITESDMVIFSSISQVTGQTYEIVGNSNSDLVTAAFAGTSLDLDITDELVGTAELTIRTTDGDGQWFDAVLIVEVVLNVETLAENFGKAGQTAAEGDLNGDGVIDTTDLTILATKYYSVGDVSGTPEPATCLLMGIGGLVSLARRRR